jgi:hypothetical protein
MTAAAPERIAVDAELPLNALLNVPPVSVTI